MPVEYTTGNLLDFPGGIKVIAHGCNRQGVMGAGFAKQLKDEAPSACEPYFDAFKDGAKPPLGAIIAAEMPGSGQRVIHCIVQDTIGTEHRQLDYEALIWSLEQIEHILRKARNEGRDWPLGLPWIGTGLAGGSRRIVKAIIEEVFEQSPVRCVVVDYVKHQPKPEPAAEPAANG